MSTRELCQKVLVAKQRHLKARRKNIDEMEA